MKLLFDQNISHRLVGLVNDILPDSKQVRDLGIENYSDIQIWEYAKKHDYVILTFDADFYDFSLVWGQPPKIVWMRSQNQTSKNIEFLLRKHLNSIIDFYYDKDLACLEILQIA